MSLRRVGAVSDFGSPEADRAKGSAVGMSPSGTGVFSFLRLWRSLRRRWSVRESAVEGTAAAGASIGGVCDGCHWNIVAGAQKSQRSELVWRPRSRLIVWPVANHIGRLCWTT